jgi:hypothetical protein
MTTAGIKRLRRIQLGRETTGGTAVAATTVWRGPAVMAVDDRELVMPDENVGLSAKTSRIYTPKLLASLEFPETEATFQQIQHVYENGLATVTLTQDGTGSDRIGIYPLPSGDAGTLKYYTIEGGDNKVEEEIEYCFTTEFQLSGKINEPIKLTRKVQGRQSLVTSFTGSLTVPTVSEMLFNKSKLYIDNVGGTLGATQISNTWIGFVLKVITGWKAQFTGDGNLYFSYPEFIGAQASLELDLLNNATSAAERVLWRAGTPRQIRIKTEGGAVTTPGTTYSLLTHLIDGAGVYTNFGPPNEENEGSNVMKANFEYAYDATAAKFLQFTVVNDLTAVP